MGWSGSLTASSTVGSAITYTPDTTTEHGYTVSAFTAPKKGVYAFTLLGSGGASYDGYAGGAGGRTVGYLLLEKGQTVYAGAGGSYSAAFVSTSSGTLLKNIAKTNLLFVAGGGGGAGAAWGGYTAGFTGGKGGGSSGTAGGGDGASRGGAAGTQTSGYEYGNGERGGYSNDGIASMHAGDGGDGLYGGYAGERLAAGGGGSGYIHATSLVVRNKTYTNTTEQGGGANGSIDGSVQVSYHARVELPVIFNGTTLERLFFNGVEVESLIYDGVKLFFRKLRRWGRCLNSAEPVSA